jgi:hypothetical protein
VSRFARNSRDWQHLVEVCRVVDTVLIDLETVYCPRLSNDRLLLGLKGSLNEYELDLLRQRSVEARRAKAQRGELLVTAPVGFLKTDAPHFEKDPDRRIQEAIGLVFQKFGEIGTVRQTLSWFLAHGLQLPIRSVSGEITWRRPSFAALYGMLTNPIYGGAYSYGKTEHVVRYENGEPRAYARRRPREEWLAFIPQTHEGYVSWEEFERIRDMMAANTRAWHRTGAATTGPALVAGLLRCRRCGRKLVVCLVDALAAKTRALGVQLVLRTEVTRIEKRDSQFRVEASTDGLVRGFDADMVVHGAGRVAEIDDLGLDDAGVTWDQRGVTVNEHLQSVSNPAVYAAGDAAATAGPRLTPVAAYEGRIVATNLLEGNHVTPDYSAIPTVVFTIPPLASLGLHEHAARERGLRFKTHYDNTASWYSSRRIGEDTSGFKVLVEEESGRLLGAHLLGPNAEEVINVFALAMQVGVSARDFKKGVFSYPTVSSDLPYMV